MQAINIVQNCTILVLAGALQMQISRHWRMNSQRYRLAGVRYQNGQIRLQPRPVQPDDVQREAMPSPVNMERVNASAGR
jgi:hypothetical protein